jgi:hypothetical protein
VYVTSIAVMLKAEAPVIAHVTGVPRVKPGDTDEDATRLAPSA